MIVIKGIRGAGKKSLMLKHLKFDFGLPSNALYITADHTLLETANDWYKQESKLKKIKSTFYCVIIENNRS